MFLSERVGSSLKRRIGVLAASHLLRFDPATGEPVGEAIDCGLQPGRPPLVTDVDGDGSDELVLLQELTVGPATPSLAPRRRAVTAAALSCCGCARWVRVSGSVVTHCVSSTKAASLSPDTPARWWPAGPRRPRP